MRLRAANEAPTEINVHWNDVQGTVVLHIVHGGADISVHLSKRDARELAMMLENRIGRTIHGMCGGHQHGSDDIWIIIGDDMFVCNEATFNKLGRPSIMTRRCVVCGRNAKCNGWPACTFEYSAMIDDLLEWCDAQVDIAQNGHDSDS